MSNRCPDCSKFVSLNQEEPEENSAFEIDAEGEITGELRAVLTCAECGTEMKDTTFDFSETPDEIAEHLDEATKRAFDADSVEPEVHELTVNGAAYDSTERYSDNKYYRARRHYYGVRAEISVECSCGESWTITLEEDQQASSFDDLN